jgi:LPXTG-site transpeptidase (sortase) family protein
MNAFKTYTAELAYQVDRKILHAEEADHIRLDISAHENVGAAAIALKPALQVPEFSMPNLRIPSISLPSVSLPGPVALKEVQRFLIAAVLIYAVLFSITNAQAYSKIFMANINEAIEAYEASIPVQNLNAIHTDPWTGERSFEVIERETPLEALEENTLTPDNGILPLDLSPSTYENRIVIPSIDVNAPIVQPEFGVEALVEGDWDTLEKQIRDSLSNGVTHYPGTARPDQDGNFFLTGHSSDYFWNSTEFSTVFALLPRLKVGDDIYITYNQREYHYQVTEMEEVYPDDVSVLEQDENKLTLMTCTPVGTQLKRLIVTAKEV